MKQVWRLFALGVFAAFALTATGCATQPSGNSNSVSVAPSPTASALPSPSPNTETKTVAVTLPVLDALFSDEAFKGELKSKLQLTDAQINSLSAIAGDEVARLRRSNAEQEGGSAVEARDRAAESIRNAVGDQKADELFALVR